MNKALRYFQLASHGGEDQRITLLVGDVLPNITLLVGDVLPNITLLVGDVLPNITLLVGDVLPNITLLVGDVLPNITLLVWETKSHVRTSLGKARTDSSDNLLPPASFLGLQVRAGGCDQSLLRCQ